MDSWQDFAACRNDLDDLFFPEPRMDKYQIRSAAGLCWGECKVQRQCLAAALNRRERWGIWGGMTPSQRERIVQATSPAERAEAARQAMRENGVTDFDRAA